MENLQADIIFYSSPAGNVKVEVIFSDETFWLNQKRIAQLFGVEVPGISKHLKNIFESGELEEQAVVSNMETTAADGKSYLTSFYNLDAVIAVGYRVNSFQATQFRIWATKTLKEFIIKGFLLDDERFGYWDCQELPYRKGDKGIGAHCLHVPRLRRESGSPANSNENGRLGWKTGCVFAI